MAKYRETLPQSSNELFLTDGGIETTLIFDEGCRSRSLVVGHVMQHSPCVSDRFKLHEKLFHGLRFRIWLELKC
jgi:hypothetical protein